MNGPVELETHVDATTDPSSVVNLRIRTETGKRTIVLKMLVTDTISQVYKLITPYSESSTFELRTNFPNKAYLPTEKANLKELGLAPSSVLIMRETA